MLKSFVGSFGELCQQQQDLMLVSSLLGEANWALDQPREARSYIKTVLPIAQKLALPLRYVRLCFKSATDSSNLLLLLDLNQLKNEKMKKNNKNNNTPHSGTLVCNKRFI